MARFPFCVIEDVQQHNQSRATFSGTTKPTSTQVTAFMDNIADEIKSIASTSGYNINSLHEVSATVALAVTTGANKAVVVSSTDGFVLVDDILMTGLTGTTRVWQVTYVTAIVPSTNTITLANVATATDAGTTTLYVYNSALRILRNLNAIGAAAQAEQAAYLGTSQDKSEHAEALWMQYYGSEETQGGLWAIKNIPNYLLGATVTSSAAHRDTITSYGSEHSTDDDVEAVFTRETEF